ncbi:NAD(P)/FAD-dependent oxidoreductase [Phenylobacterium sp.]|jgi:monoamine oxidase|uniref:flavin monoamine oxidase family protein n=1 Tax=Phenylobacterium sp. TaxID=1871053 RepID=UPI002F415DF3
MKDRFDVAVIGCGAAGIAALGRLARTGLEAVGLEARERVGGRAHTVTTTAGFPVDAGAGWLHSADRNPLSAPIERAGFTIDRSPPHWTRQAFNQHLTAEEQRAYRAAFNALDEKVEAAAKTGIDRPASELMEPESRWNPLLDAFSSYYNGAEFESVSVLDYAAYEDSGINWRVREGYGAALSHFADPAQIVTGCPVSTVHHDGPELALDTARGRLTARAVIVCVPSPILSQGGLAFSPGLPGKAEAAAGLPLGLADKVFLSLAEPEGLPVEGHLFGHSDRTETASYHLRPFGRPYIEVFLGGRCARGLEGEGSGALAAFALEELGELMGSDFRRGLASLGETRWAHDPWALGSYSHALPGHAPDRQVLAAPVEERIFFAGEATHRTWYSTVHGAWESGTRAAEEALIALTK